jgi:hypothetical protein
MRSGLALMTLAACAQAPAPTQETGDTYVPWVDPCDAVRARANRHSCTSGIKGEPSPAFGASGVALSPTFAYEFITDEHDSSCFELTSDRGAPVLTQPTYAQDGRAVWFGPAAPLQPDSDYLLNIYYSCDKVAPIAFHTASAGVDMSDADLAGKAYQLELGSGAWVAQNGDPTYLVRTLFRTGALLVLVPQPPTEGRPTWSALAGALDESGAQAACAPTTTVDLRQSLGALRTVRLFDLDLPTSGGARMVHTSFYGELVSDGSAVVGVQLEGFFDVRDVVVNDDHTVGAACALLEGFDGLSCGPCPADDRGGGDYCVPFHLVNGVAPSVETTITPKDRASIEADPACTPPA